MREGRERHDRGHHGHRDLCGRMVVSDHHGRHDRRGHHDHRGRHDLRGRHDRRGRS